MKALPGKVILKQRARGREGRAMWVSRGRGLLQGEQKVKAWLGVGGARGARLEHTNKADRGARKWERWQPGHVCPQRA